MSCDVVVVGGGVNGLATAAALGRAGRKVLVLEARAQLGGLAASVEFHPGYHSAGVLSDTSAVRPALIDELRLQQHGLRRRETPRPPVALARGKRLDLATPPSSVAEGLGALRGFLARVRPVLEGFCDQPPIDMLDLEAESTLELLKRGLRLRRLGRADMLDLLRIAPMTIADWLREYLGSSEEADGAAAALALPALRATFTAPRSPGGVANLLLLESMRAGECEGGTTALVSALERAAQDAHVEIRTGARVASIEVESGRARGVTLAGGERIDAPIVAASCDPRTALLDLVHPRHISIRLAERLRCYRSRGTTAHLLLALRAPTDLPTTAVIADGLDDIERAFDPIKYRELPVRPVLELHRVSDDDSALCPPGHAVLSALVHFVPPTLEAGWSDESRQALTSAALARISEYAGGLSDALVATHLSTPIELATDLGLTGGNLHHGERAIDQLLVRPVPECSGYSTPIGGLFLCGGGTHPGGGLHGGNGRLAAKVISGER